MRFISTIHKPISVSPASKTRTQNLDIQATCILGCYVHDNTQVSLFYASFHKFPYLSVE